MISCPLQAFLHFKFIIKSFGRKSGSFGRKLNS